VHLVVRGNLGNRLLASDHLRGLNWQNGYVWVVAWTSLRLRPGRNPLIPLSEIPEPPLSNEVAMAEAIIALSSSIGGLGMKSRLRVALAIVAHRALRIHRVAGVIYFARKQRNDTYLLGSQKNPPKDPLSMVIVCPSVGTGQTLVLSTCFQIAPSVVVRSSLPSA